MMIPWSRSQTIGRELDPRVAIVSGEGALQKIRHPEPRKGTHPVGVWQRLPSQPEKHGDYYGLPLLKEPVWIWSVPLYFYFGGVAGGVAVLAAMLHGKGPMQGLASKCRWLAFLGTTVGPGLLTWDLGRKVRFLNMLRVFRPTSPMSIGSWSLAGSGLLSTLALVQGNRKSATPTAWALSGGGMMLAGYTGVLLSNSANPVWEGARITLPVLFTASAVASTSGLLELLPLGKREDRVVHRFGRIGKVAEATAMVAMEREVGRNPEIAESFRQGRGGMLWKASKALLAGGMLINLLPLGSARKRRVSGILTTAGALCLRFSLLEMGKHAARVPQATINPQRRSIGNG